VLDFSTERVGVALGSYLGAARLKVLAGTFGSLIEVHRSFPQPLQANAGGGSTLIIPRPLPSKSFPNHHNHLINLTLCGLASENVAT
jgi:hypothetical protein